MSIFELGIYGLIGIAMMLIGYQIIDFVIPCDFPEELKKGNKSVGWLSAGIYMGLGFIIRSAIISNVLSSHESSLFVGIKDTLLFGLAGIVFFLIAYFIIDFVNKKYNFNQELQAGNEAIGIMLFGIFIGISFIVSGVIQ